ncbi:MAG: hypothetical protein AAF725_12525 [Acidobacteriota bacterium]
MPHFYSAFGLVIESDRRLPGWPRCGPSSADLTLSCGAIPACFSPSGLEEPAAWQPVASSPHLSEDGLPLVRVERHENGFYRFCYYDQSIFWTDPEARKAWMTWPEESCLEAAILYFTGPVMTWILRSRGRCVLHAAAVDVEGGGAVLLAGAGGAGKSTTAAALLARGRSRLLSDDTSALEFSAAARRARKAPRPAPARSIVVFPEATRIRLGPESGDALGDAGEALGLGGDLEALPRLCPDWDKRALDVSADQTAREPAPVAAVFLLSEPRTQGPPSLELLEPAEAFPELVARGAAPELISREQSARSFDLLSHLAESVPVLRLERGAADAREIATLIANRAIGLGPAARARAAAAAS